MDMNGLASINSYFLSQLNSNWQKTPSLLLEHAMPGKCRVLVSSMNAWSAFSAPMIVLWPSQAFQPVFVHKMYLFRPLMVKSNRIMQIWSSCAPCQLSSWGNTRNSFSKSLPHPLIRLESSNVQNCERITRQKMVIYFAPRCREILELIQVVMIWCATFDAN